MNIGDKVKVLRMPDGIPPGNPQLETLFRGCVGKTFAVNAVDGDLIELYVGEAFGKPANYHQIWLEASNLRVLEA